MTGGIMAGTLTATAQQVPVLPSRTPAQLITQVLRSQPRPFSGTVVESASLGLPSLPDTGDPTSLPSLLSGSHAVKVWRAGAGTFRLSMPDGLNETDVYGDGAGGWLWQSAHETATRLSLGCSQAQYSMGVPANGRMLMAPPLGQNVTGTVEAHPVTGRTSRPTQRIVAAALAALGRSTKVSVGTNAMIAGRPAYDLVFAPKDPRSLIGAITIAIDARDGMTLREQIFARDAASPAISAGFTQLSLTPPAAGDVTFTPPRGATVHNAGPGCGGAAGAPRQQDQSSAGVIGGGWLTVLKLPRTALTGLASGGAQTGPPPSTPAGALGPAGGEGNAFGALLRAATPVSGAWGSGSLLRSSLVSMLFTGDHVYLGAVQPSVLYAAAGQQAG